MNQPSASTTEFDTATNRANGRRRLAGIAVALLAVAAGCAKPAGKVGPPPIYTGPTDALDVVLARINANNGRISTLRGEGGFEATIPDAKPSFVNGTFTLLHSKPTQFRLDLNKDIAGTIMRLGVNESQFWLSIFANVDTTWYGNTDARGNERAAKLPIDPTLVADVLGVATLNTDLLAQPVPTMRFNPDYDAYMLTWSTPRRDRWVILREVWYDRQTLEPRRVWLFDRNGRVQMRAVLSNFAPLDGGASDAPRVARRLELFAPDTGSRLSLRFEEVRPSRNNAPNRFSYRFNPETAGTTQTVDLDAAGPPSNVNAGRTPGSDETE